MNKQHSFSKTLSQVRLSPIVKISELVKERSVHFKKMHGEDFVFFQRGEIAFSTPGYIIEAAQAALLGGKTRYPKSGGEPILKEAILKKLERSNGTKGLGPDNVLVTYGGQEALQLAFKLFEGKNGAGFGPCWSCVLENFVPYSDINFELVPLLEDFAVNWEVLGKVMQRISFFYLNNPQNPTGKVFTEMEVRRISALCKANGVYLISDEAYEQITFDGVKHFSALALNQPHIIGCFTFSKAYAMTGWRVGYMVCMDPQVIWLCCLGDYSQTAGVVTFVQHAAAAAIEKTKEEAEALGPMMRAYAERRDLLFTLLSEIEGLELNKPEGAFYFFPSFKKWIPETLKGEARQKFIFERLLEKGVAVVYGSCFGEEFSDHVRISFSGTTPNQIIKGVRRLKETLECLRVPA